MNIDAWHRVMRDVELVGEPGASEAHQWSVLVCLAYYANKGDPYAYPSVPTIAAHTRLGTTTVRRSLRALEAAGLIVGPSSDARRGGNTRTVRYRLAFIQPNQRGRAEKSTTQPGRRSAQPGDHPSPTTLVAELHEVQEVAADVGPADAGLVAEAKAQARALLPRAAPKPRRAA